MNTKVKTRTWIALLNLLFLFTAINAQPVRQHLHEGWNFRQARGTNWYEATVPGTVHTDLMDNKLIDDPFYRLNERGVQWVDKEDWIANQKNFNQSVADRIARQSSFPDTEEVLVEWTDFTRDEDGDVWAKMKILKGDEAVVKSRLEANMVMGRFIYDVEKDMVHVIGFDI